MAVSYKDCLSAAEFISKVYDDMMTCFKCFVRSFTSKDIYSTNPNRVCESSVRHIEYSTLEGRYIRPILAQFNSEKKKKWLEDIPHNKCQELERKEHNFWHNTSVPAMIKLNVMCMKRCLREMAVINDTSPHCLH